MKYDIDFAAAGLIYTLLLYFFIRIQYNQQITSIKELRKLLVLMFLANLTDIITCYTISYSDSVSLVLNYILNIAFFEFEAITVAHLPRYMKSLLITKGISQDLWDKINYAFLLIYSGVIASTPFSHAIFYFDDAKTYQHGFLYFSIFIVPVYFFIYTAIRLVIYRKHFSKRQFHSITGFLIAAMFGPGLQMFAGNKVIDFFTLSISCFIVIIGLETPDYLKLEKTLKELETHKTLLEEAHRKEEERTKVLHEMTKSASWGIRFKGQEVVESFWSEEFFWLLGYERSELDNPDMLWSESLHPEDSKRATESFSQGLQGIAPFDLIYRLRSKNGEYRWYRGTGELKMDSDGETLVYQGIIQDVHEEKIREELAQERLTALEELERSQEALKEAVRKAESADRAKSDFLANMSHEIRTPINAVLGLNELIIRESTEDQIKNYSENIADAGNALLSLINDILDFSKIEAGRMELSPYDYDLGVLLREVNNMIYIRCVDRDIKFILKNDSNIPNLLHGDEVRIRQILINLLNNAIKYTDSGSVTLDVHYEQTSAEEITLVMSAIDTGIGIKEEDLPALFQSFKRIDLDHNRKKEGTGLGLSITKSFVELMGGSIDVTSVYGKGSTFTVRIPQQVVGDTKLGTFDGNAGVTKSQKYEASFTAPTARILVVDDVPMNLKVIKGLLKQTLIVVDTVSSGQECLNVIADTPYDIILLDHMMPEMDGIETLKRINADPTHVNQNTPVIMLTANAILGAKEEYLGLGFIDYLSKPVPPEKLEEMMQKYLPDKKIIRS